MIINYVVAYIAAAIVFCTLDYVWLILLAKDFYQQRMGFLMAEEPRLLAAAGFYVLYLVGLLVFAMTPAIRAQSWLVAASLGGFLGLIAYASYDLTNLATLKNWSVSLSLVDICWGVVVSSLSATAGFFAVRMLEKFQ